MEKARKISVDVLMDVFNKNAFSNIALGRQLNKYELDVKDKALTTEIVYGTIKYKYTIDCILEKYIKNGLKKVDSMVLNILRISIYQLRYLDKIPEFAVVNEAVELSKKKSSGASKLVNGVLRNYIRNKDIKYYDENNLIESLCFNYSFPKWLVELFINQYEIDDVIRILQGLNMRPYVTVRVNNLKTTYEDALKALEESGYDVEEGEVCPEAVIIKKGSSIENNPLYIKGEISVQDESAMLVAPIMDLTENMNVLDLCSAPGGKACHAAEIMNNTGKVYAFDIQENKLSLINENVKRLGIKNITVSRLDASKYLEKLAQSGDRVLIDVPCSGIGIIRKKPEIKWTKDLIGTRNLVNIQRSIMENASRYTKNGGKLIYSTCTLNKEENEDNIKWFIEKHNQFTIEPIYLGKFSNVIYHKEGYVTILPNENMDGFFICKMKKSGR
ncbi:MAG: 16S rRNA (cytosine(967)-C(5))-methyltransferase RsmB [Solirubrobacterales bacterium]